MMRFLTMLLALAIAAPVSAEEPLTPDEDLQCGLLTAAAAANGGKDSDMQTGAAGFVSYFFGRYEGRTGRKFDDGATRELVVQAITNAQALAPRCQVAAMELAKRMQGWGQALRIAEGRK